MGRAESPVEQTRTHLELVGVHRAGSGPGISHVQSIAAEQVIGDDLGEHVERAGVRARLGVGVVQGFRAVPVPRARPGDDLLAGGRGVLGIHAERE